MAFASDLTRPSRMVPIGMSMSDLRHLTDHELTTAIDLLNASEREATAALVAHLAELEARELHLALGFKSLYGYCRHVLHLAEHEAYNRMQVAGVARRFPVVIAMLADGAVHLTAIRLLAPHLGDENHLALLGGAIHKSKAEVKELIARWFPKPDAKTSIRATPRGRADESPQKVETSDPVATALGAARAAGRQEPAIHAGSGPQPSLLPPPANPEQVSVVGQRPVPANRRPSLVEPLSEQTFLMRLTAKRRTVDRLRRAQELLSHAVPDGDVDEILYRALGELIGRLEGRSNAPAMDGATSVRKSGGMAPKARRAARATAADSRHIPSEVERLVRARDGDRCAFVGRGGRRCVERRFVQLHHVRPWAAGGPPTTDNIQLRCHAHNQYEARQYFGPIAADRAAHGENSLRNENAMTG